MLARRTRACGLPRTVFTELMQIMATSTGRSCSTWAASATRALSWTARAHKSEIYIDGMKFKDKHIAMEVLCRAKQTR